MEWSVVAAEPADSLQIAGMVGELLGEIMASTGQAHFHFDGEAARQRLVAWLEVGDYRAFLARAPGDPDPLGVICVTETQALYAGGALGLVPEFFVRPAWRSRGVGRALLQRVRALGAERGWGRLEVTTPPLPAFERTFAFYERQGLTVAGGRKMKLEL
ncbi:MAG TPA: GNAT family N-acetyltransferase [Gammaproteobacteria bacterium]|nr:GNAT family N-acetyltransferase [Gammaproteobacteria bacterium]